MHNDLKKDKKPSVKQGWTIKGIEMETRLSLQKAAIKEANIDKKGLFKKIFG